MTRIPIAAAAGAALITSLAVGLETGRGQATSEPLILQYSRSAPVAVTDGGRRGEGAGDVLHFRGPVSAGGRAAGTLSATADAVSGRAAQFIATVDLRGRGALALQGTLDFSRRRQGTLAIVGGTGEFDGAGGSATVQADPERRITFTVRLRP